MNAIDKLLSMKINLYLFYASNTSGFANLDELFDKTNNY